MSDSLFCHKQRLVLLAIFLHSQVLLVPEKCEGLKLSGAFKRIKDNTYGIVLTFENLGTAPMLGFAIQFNKNIYGISNQGQIQVVCCQ